MGSRVALQSLVAELGRRAGMDGLTLDRDGFVALRVDGRFTLHAVALDGEGGEALLYVPLGPVPAQERQVLYRRMLEANFAADGSATAASATLALHGETGRAVLVRRIEPEVMAWPGFERAVEHLLAAAETWSGELAAPAGQDQYGSGREDAPPTGLAEIDILRFGIRA
jgi:Tir chaperone protein (CesT) family